MAWFLIVSDHGRSFPTEIKQKYQGRIFFEKKWINPWKGLINSINAVSQTINQKYQGWIFDDDEKKDRLA